MRTMRINRLIFIGLLLALVLQIPGLAAAHTTFKHIVVFGDSLSDPGNAFALIGVENVPPYDLLDQYLIPDRPYAIGGHHFSNGPTWIEQLAKEFGLARDARPAFQGTQTWTKATNYAVGGARARDDGLNLNLSAQVDKFLNDFSGVAPSDALYVIEFGSNDVRDALATKSTVEGALVLTAALESISKQIGFLYAAGARKFLICNVPDLSLTPAIIKLNSRVAGVDQTVKVLSATYNSGLDSILELMESMASFEDIKIARVDFFKLLTDVHDNPRAFGLKVVDEACITPNVAPYTCRKPNKFLFWDGIHPTKAGHAIISQGAELALTKSHFKKDTHHGQSGSSHCNDHNDHNDYNGHNGHNNHH